MSKIQKDDFLKKYRISEDNFNKTNLKWTDLLEIYEDHVNNYRKFSIISNYVFEVLAELPVVHSIRKRIKDPEHLIEKIIRKSIDNPNLGISCENYHEIITDLIGVRALHLYKEDWIHIHNRIINTWETVEKPTANIRKGDSEEVYIENGCNIREHKYGYRSVHYLIKFPCTKDSNKIVEIQVRTLFEEAWSEIDHTIRYPYDIDNPILAGYLVVFNSLAGSADQMGSFIKFLKQELNLRSKEIEEKDMLIKKLKEDIYKSELGEPDKERITESLNKINSGNYVMSSLSSYLSNSLISPSTFNIDQSTLQFMLNNSERYKNLQDVLNTNILNNTLQLGNSISNYNKIGNQIKEDNEDNK